MCMLLVITQDHSNCDIWTKVIPIMTCLNDDKLLFMFGLCSSIVWTIFKICFTLVAIATCKLAIEILPFFFIQFLLVFFFFFLCTLVTMHGQRLRGMLGVKWIFVVSLLYFCLIFVFLLIITCLLGNFFLQSICFNFDLISAYLIQLWIFTMRK